MKLIKIDELRQWIKENEFDIAPESDRYDMGIRCFDLNLFLIQKENEHE